MKKLFEKLGITDMKSFWKFALEFLKFGIVGISNTAISLIAYYILLHFGMHYIIANSIGFVLGVLNSFFWNSNYVFKKTDRRKSVLLKTFISYGITFLLSTLLLYLMIDVIGVSEFLAPIINLFITTPLNFLLNKYWAYK